MSAFEDFVQVELPLRPYVEVDPDLETIPIRRGAGPRQLQFVDLADGEVLGKVGGTLQGVSIGSISAQSHNHDQAIASTQWVINHAQGSENYIIQIRDVNGSVIIPDEITTGDGGGLDKPNNVTVDFTTAIDGKAFIVFT